MSHSTSPLDGSQCHIIPKDHGGALQRTSYSTCAQDSRSCHNVPKKPCWCVAEKYSFWQAEHGVASEGVPDTILLVIYVVVKVLLQWQHHLMLNKEGGSHKESQRFWLAFEADAAQHKSLVGKMTDCIHLFSSAI